MALPATQKTVKKFPRWVNQANPAGKVSTQECRCTPSISETRTLPIVKGAPGGVPAQAGHQVTPEVSAEPPTGAFVSTKH